MKIVEFLRFDAVIANLSVLFAFIGVVIVPLYLARRRRDRRRLAELAAIEARAGDRAGDETLAAILAAAPASLGAESPRAVEEPRDDADGAL